MNIIQLDPSNKKHIQDFLALPFRLYKDIPQWVPPLDSDVRLMLDPKRHPFYQHSSAAFFLAYRDNLPAGRLAVLDNVRFNDFNHTHTAFFYLFECEDDLDAPRGLFDAACGWARTRNLTEIYGPKGFTPLDGFGLLVKGFEHRPALGLPYNPAYYPNLIEANGFTSTGEAVSGYLDARFEFPPRIHELAERIQKRRGLRIARFNSRSDMKTFIPHLKELYNGMLEGTEGNYPLTDAEVDAMASQLLWFADPRLIKAVMKDDKIVGFMLAYPDISAALQKTKGKLFPFGWLTLLLELRRTDWININGAGLLPEYRGSGGTAILFSEMYKSAAENPRYRHADVVQIGVENEAMQREMENFGINFYKMHRVYKKKLQ